MRRTIFLLLGVFGLLLLAVGYSRSLRIALPRGAVDFRNRVVAARQAELGLNPYRFKWDPGYPETLLDPSQENDAKFTRMTSPPTTLRVHSWFADRSYRAQKAANLGLSWICLLLVAFTLATRLPARFLSRIESVALTTFVTGVFAVSGIWLFHVERGQQYAYLAVFLVLAVFPPAAFRRFAGHRLFAALAVFFRFSLVPAAFLSFRQKRPVRDLVATALLGTLLLIPVLVKYPLAWWLDYFASARDWYFHRFAMHARIPFIPFSMPFAPEGDPDLRSFISFLVPGNVLYHFFWKLGVDIPYSVGLTLFIVGTVAMGIVLFQARKEEVSYFALRFFAGMYILDHLLPAPRSGYNAVLFFPGLILAMQLWLSSGKKTARERDWNWAFGAPIAVGIAYSLRSLWNPVSSPFGVETFYLFGAVLALFQPIRSEAPAGET
jgi:hypothetical protein